MKTLADRIQDADVRASQWLADANDFEERGNYERAATAYARSGFWRDRFNLLTNQSDKERPSR